MEWKSRGDVRFNLGVNVQLIQPGRLHPCQLSPDYAEVSQKRNETNLPYDSPNLPEENHFEPFQVFKTAPQGRLKLKCIS